MRHQRCRTCGHEKPEKDFYRNDDDGKPRARGECKACYLKKMREARRAGVIARQKNLDSRKKAEIAREDFMTKKDRSNIEAAYAALRKHREEYFNTSPAQERKQNL